MTFSYTLTSSGGFNHANGAYKATQLVDSAEDGDILEYADNVGNWRAADYGTTAYDGSWVLEHYTSGGVGSNSAIVSMPGDGLPRYPERGNTLGGYVRLDEALNYAGLIFFAQENRNTFPSSYRFSVRGEQNDLRLIYEDVQNDVFEVLDSTSVDVSGMGSDWLLMRVDTGDHGLIGDLYNGGQQLAQVSSGDLRYDSGGIGVWAERRVGSSSTAYTAHDFLHLIE